MRGILSGLVLLGLASAASAGVYNMGEVYPVNLPPVLVRSYILQLRSIAVAPKGKMGPGSMRAQVLQQAAALEREKDNGTFSTLDRINLGACYIRLGQPRDAIRLLTAGDQSHFLIQANLASAYFRNGDLENAEAHQRKVIALWPGVCAFWSDERVQWFLRCEKVFLRLLTARIFRNQRRQTGEIDLDPIFKNLNLISPGERGEYRAGPLPMKIQEQIPHQTVGITLQLVTWYPEDHQLYWLLAELFNAFGEVSAAFDMIDQDLVWSGAGGRFKGLKEHRRILERVAKVQKEISRDDRKLLLLAIFAGLPRGTLAPPGVGTIAEQVAATMPTALINPPLQLPAQSGTPGPDLGVPLPSEQQVPFNWQHVTVGFAFGFLVAALLGFQWQEWRRRTALQQALDPIEEPPGAPQEMDTNIKPGES